MKITVIGAGNIGLVVALTFSKLGHRVVLMDHDANKICQLQASSTYIYEPDLEPLLREMNHSGRLLFTSEYSGAALEAEIFFVCVGTPSHPGGSTDLTQLYSALNHLKKEIITNGKTLVLKSTVPPGTTDLLAGQYPEFKIIFNPEFISEGTALQDFQNPDRIVIGTESPKKAEVLRILYDGFLKDSSKFLIMSTVSAELCKYAANAFLAARVSLINEFSRIAEKVNANIDDVANAVGLDHRIGPKYLRAGIGYGGSCLPKDVSVLIEFSRLNDLSTTYFDAIRKSNDLQFLNFFEKITSYFEKNRSLEKSVTIWGVSFKPLTNDLRSSPAIKLIINLLNLDFKVNIHDPRSLENAQKEIPETHRNKSLFFDDAYSALEGSSALIIGSAWPEYRIADFELIQKLLKNPIIFDSCNLFQSERILFQKIQYVSVGRPS